MIYIKVIPFFSLPILGYAWAFIFPYNLLDFYILTTQLLLKVSYFLMIYHLLKIILPVFYDVSCI